MAKPFDIGAELRPSDIPRFWTKVKKRPGSTACWLWTAYLDDSGYGRLQLRKRWTPAHRISWTIHFGDIPEGMNVCHRCDVPACIRPDHLFLGTQLDNIRDMDRKGRGNRPIAELIRRQPELLRRGEAHPNAKLTEADVLAIREAWPTVSSLKLAAQFGVSKPVVLAIVHRRTWKHIP